MLIFLSEFQNVADIRSAEGIQRLIVIAHRPKSDAVIDKMIDEPDLARVDVLIFIDQYMIKGARDRTAIGFAVVHRLDDKWNHVGEIDGAGVSLRHLIDMKIFDGLLEHVIVAVDGGGKPISIQQALFRPCDDVQDVGLLVPPHLARAEDVSLLGGIPKLKPLRKPAHARILVEQPECEGMKGLDVKARPRRQVQQPHDAVPHLVGGLLGESYGEDACRVSTLPDKMNKAAR